jgi:hypothetical protein
LSVPEGVLSIEATEGELLTPGLRDECKSATGYTRQVDDPKAGEVYCVKTDESRVVVMQVLDAGLDSNKAVVRVVVW